MWDQIVVMNYTVLARHLSAGELGVVHLADSWLAKVNHRHGVAGVQKFHSSELCKSTSQTVASGLNCIGRIESS